MRKTQTQPSEVWLNQNDSQLFHDYHDIRLGSLVLFKEGGLKKTKQKLKRAHAHTHRVIFFFWLSVLSV